ncbi:putative P-loop containing nucleoside triphosphate hydrolase, shikimate kinase/gluconokinase [Rosa chinensis]|uniref:Putative P-loop containing nucleoside triphosphate hydrolase, shikimate kinase/gluconokinase n=1 Tax=Rosa chinensis TaxID=74649 RepID=A0A2P6S6L3_ROSCH|nr:probable inactive shikimate kinase like 1, chloroplastic [Rosa chinensis]PRQ54323.1 putative P-loop containing nucleoside triphosphate hydrolase, shikimate kinase/gluconokinase [Rosa chinensis]
MEITRTLLPSSSCSSLHLRTPLLHFHVSPSHPQSLPQDVLQSQTSLPIPSRTRFRKPLAASDGTTSATKVAVDDPSLAVKKKAMDVSPELKGTTIFLVGMKSSIKTSLGKFLANLLRYYYFDSDSLVEEAAGTQSATKSLRETDKSGFQESETEVLKQLSSMGRLVVCAGDGATQSSTNLALLRHGITIWIDVPLDIVARGVVEDQTQLSAYDLSTSVSYPEVLTHLSTSYEELRGGYAIADATVSLQQVAGKLGYDEIDDVTTEDMALEVLKEVEKLTRVKKMMEAAARPF